MTGQICNLITRVYYADESIAPVSMPITLPRRLYSSAVYNLVPVQSRTDASGISVTSAAETPEVEAAVSAVVADVATGAAPSSR